MKHEKNENMPHIRALDSKFLQSAQKIDTCFAPYCTEIAILGRSNVGKSSFINLLLNHKLAKSSSTPGKTRLINFFQTTWEMHKQETNLAQCDINKQDSIRTNCPNLPCHAQEESKERQAGSEKKALQISLVFVDLPGFGYAKVSKGMKHDWDKNLTNFIMKRESIKLFCHLIDSRHRDLAIDKEIANFLEATLHARKDCKILQIYTKNDKLNKNEYHKLKAEQKLSISVQKKIQKDIQQLYNAILRASFDWSSFDE